MIRFPFTVGRAFLKSGHPITIPKAYYRELKESGLHETTDVEIVWPDATTTQGYIFRSVAGFGTYYQIRVRGGVRKTSAANMVIGQSLLVEIRPLEGYKVILISDAALPRTKPPLPTPIAEDTGEPEPTIRSKCVTYRVLRDTSLARQVKADNSYKCQICGTTLHLADGSPYAEAHHIKPLGKPHNGPDVRPNIICVCPNHHVLLDYGAISLTKSDFPEIAEEYIDYHNSVIYKGSEGAV